MPQPYEEAGSALTLGKRRDLQSSGGTSVRITWAAKAILCTLRLRSINSGPITLVIRILALILCISPALFSQEESAPSGTRAGQIQAERSEKAANLVPEELTH